MVPRAAPGPRGAVAGRTARPARSRGRPGLPSCSSRPVPRILKDLRHRPKPIGKQGFLMIFRKILDFSTKPLIFMKFSCHQTCLQMLPLYSGHANSRGNDSHTPCVRLSDPQDVSGGGGVSARRLIFEKYQGFPRKLTKFMGKQ